MNWMEIVNDAHTWVAVAFILFLLLASKFIFPKVGVLLDARAEKIRAELIEAENLKKEAEALLIQAKKKLKDADQAAAEIVERARFETKQIADDAEKEIENEMERKMRLAEEKIARAESSAIESVKARAVESAIEAAREIITKELSGAKAKSYTKASADLITKKIA